MNNSSAGISVKPNFAAMVSGQTTFGNFSGKHGRRIATRLASMMLGLTLSVGVHAAGAVGADPVQPDLAKGQKIAGSICAACHGGDGNSAMPVNPKLAGQHYDYLYKQLKEFKSVDGAPAARANAVMAGFAALLPDEDMKSVAAHFASQKMVLSTSTDKALAEAGQAIFRGGDASRGLPACAGCHGPSGAGIPGQYPRLAGQHAEYIASQLTAFRQGTRSNSSVMTAVAAKLSDQDIKALADYIAGQR